MKVSTFLIAVSICFFARIQVNAQAYETSFLSAGTDNFVFDIFELGDSAYMAIQSFAVSTFPTADSIEIFKLDRQGNKTKSKIIKDHGYHYSRPWRGVQVPNDGQVIYFSSKYHNATATKKAYVFCVDHNLNIIWERHGIEPQSSSFESFSQGIWQDQNIVLYGLITDEANSFEDPFFWKLDANGNTISIESINSMKNRWRGNDSFVFSDKYVYFFNASQVFYKCDRSNYDLIDSLEINLDTAFMKGMSMLLPSGNIALGCEIDSVLSFNPPKQTSAAAILFYDDEGNYLNSFRRIVNPDLPRVTIFINGMDQNKFGRIFLAGFEGVDGGGKPKSDWLSLQCLNEDRSLIWERYYRLGKRFNSYRTKACQDGGVLLTGYTFLDGESDGQIYKFDSLGNLNTILPTNAPEAANKYVFVKTYPNPTSSVINFESDLKLTYSIDVVQADGQIVYREQVNEKIYILDLKGKTRGTYFFILRDESGQIFQTMSIALIR
jgi:hypothetical protein